MCGKQWVRHKANIKQYKGTLFVSRNFFSLIVASTGGSPYHIERSEKKRKNSYICVYGIGKQLHGERSVVITTTEFTFLSYFIL